MMSKQEKDGRPFSERHPRLNGLIGVLLLMCLILGGMAAIKIVVSRTIAFVVKVYHWLESISNSLDAVIVVALITGAVSIIGVIISSIIAKYIDYKKDRKSYLAQQREKPYGEFVEMFYKVLENGKKPGSYTEEQMRIDLSKFSKQITLWGSPKVVNKWVEFRKNGSNPDAGEKTLFLMESIMNEMRKDLGLRKVKKGNLLSFFINDIEKIMNK